MTAPDLLQAVGVDTFTLVGHAKDESEYTCVTQAAIVERRIYIASVDFYRNGRKMVDNIGGIEMTHASRMAEIKAREAAAQRGDWTSLIELKDRPINHRDTPMVMNGEWVIADVFGGSKRGANCDFIAHSRQDIPYLLARVEALEALIESAYCEGYEDSKDHGSHWSNSVSRAALEGEDNGN